jgi:predicted O-methyltransferase YrrM
MYKILVKIFLKFLYIKTKIHQALYKDGSFPYDDYLILSKYIQKYNLKSGLEIGTAIGLTAITCAALNTDFKLDTIEKQKINIGKAKKNIKLFENVFGFLYKNIKLENRISIVEGRMFDVLESSDFMKVTEVKSEKNNEKSEVVIKKNITYKKYDYVFLDAYISRYNEVIFLENFLKRGGIFIVSNIRDDFQKSVHAKNFLLEKERFIFLEKIGDTIFVKKLL